MSHVERCRAASGELKEQAVVAFYTVAFGLLLDPFGELRTRGQVGFIDMLKDEHLGAVDGRVRLSAGKSGVPGQRRIAAGVDKAVGRHAHIAVAGGQFDFLDPRTFAHYIAQHRTEDHRDAGVENLLANPATQGDFVVINHGGQGTDGVVQISRGAQVAQNAVGNAVGQQLAVRAVGKQPAKGPDDRADRLTAEHRQRIEQHHALAERSGFQSGGNTRDASAGDTYVSLQALGGGSAGTAYRANYMSHKTTFEV